jgi:hypothetical protein
MPTAQEELKAFLHENIKSEADLNLNNVRSLLDFRKTEQTALDSKVNLIAPFKRAIFYI